MIEITTDYHNFWNQINKNNKVILYEAGYRTDSISNTLIKADIPWDYIIDINENKNNTFLANKKVVLPKYIKEYYKNQEKYYIVVTSNDIDGAIKIIAQNFENAVVLTPQSERNLNNYNDMFAPVRNKLLNNKNFTIISNDCIAARMYCMTDSVFNTPTIATIIKPDDYIKFCKKPEHYLEKDIKFNQWNSTYMGGTQEKYPEFQIDDIKIHFVHTSEPDKAKADWDRRKERFNINNLIMVLGTLQYTVSPNQFREFLEIKHGKKLIFQYHTCLPLEHSISVFDKQGLFNLPHIAEYWFDVVGFLNGDIEY